MAARKRDSVERSPSSDSQMTYTEFMRRFPDDAACLVFLRDRFYPAGSECPTCHKASRFHRVTGRAAFACQFCGHHVYPTAGTIFEKSTTSLQLWFWAMYLMASTRCGISAKQLEREIGVSYHTAHRMFKKIRTLLSDEGEPPLSGDVEVDETYHGGKPRAAAIRNKTGNINKTQRAPVFGMVERGGRVRARVLPDTGGATINRTLAAHVLPEAMIFTDEWPTYRGLGKTYRGHKRIRHKARIYVEGDTHTQTVEGFFGLFKNGVRGVYHAVSREYLQSYVDEYAFRYNRRDGREPMFWAILDRVEKSAPSAPSAS